MRRGGNVPNPTWVRAYGDLIDQLPAYAAHARWTLCGLQACVDAFISLHAADALLDAAAPPPAVALAAELTRRAAAGIGGEIRVDWPEGPDWLDRALAPRPALGGTGPHTARVLTTLGAPALLALGCRDAEQLGVVDGTISLASAGRPVPAAQIAPVGAGRPKIYIFEYTAGRSVGPVTPPRSSRVIVRFTDPGIESDPEFDAVSVALAPRAGAGLLAGFNAIGRGDLAGAVRRAHALAARWRAGGVGVVHLELAGYDAPALRDSVIAGLSDVITSLGMSHSEYQDLVAGPAPTEATVRDYAATLGIERVCVHADTWALAATRGDAGQERAALMMGCLLAGTRAALGRPAVPRAVPQGAQFETAPPQSAADAGGWRVVSVAAPYLAHPETTLGLGDTFTAGCLLVLGQPTPPSANHSASEDDVPSATPA
jgi:ADP-dependent phosphofructokinase/glucokinase